MPATLVASILGVGLLLPAVWADGQTFGPLTQLAAIEHDAITLLQHSASVAAGENEASPAERPCDANCDSYQSSWDVKCSWTGICRGCEACPLEEVAPLPVARPQRKRSSVARSPKRPRSRTARHPPPSRREQLWRKNNIGGIEWPYQSKDMPDVWLHWTPAPVETEMWAHFPAFATIGQALNFEGASVALTAAGDLKAIKQNVTKSVKRGRVPIIILHRAWDSDVPGVEETFSACKKAGAYVILYQSEPFEAYDSDATGDNEGYKRFIEAVHKYQADEIWEYSKGNVEFYASYSKSQGHARLRYMPPGNARLLQFGVASARANYSPSSIGVLSEEEPLGPASSSLITGIDAVKPMLRSAVDGGRQGVYDMKTTMDFLQDFHVQANFHRNNRCCPLSQPVDSFRLAWLLSNSRCVISQRSHLQDELIYQGMVNFASDFKAAFDFVSQGVRSCQQTTSTIFGRRMSPKRIMARSNFVAEFQQRTGVRWTE